MKKHHSELRKLLSVMLSIAMLFSSFVLCPVWAEDAPSVAEALEIVGLKDKINKSVCIVSQTTFNHNKFEYFVEVFKKYCYNTDVMVVNTVCNATDERQKEAASLAASVDAMIVIGDSQSSNSRKLYEICKAECDNTYFIQTLKDLHLELPTNAGLVGITAGASTPNHLIKEVQEYVRNEL